MERVLHTGPKGGIYYMNSTGNRVYVTSRVSPRSPSRVPSSPRIPITVLHVNGHTDGQLTPQQEKFCHCLKKVEAKGSAYNPAAVCAKSTGGSLGRGHHCPNK